MNSVHHFLGAIFDAILTPLELLGDEVALVLVSGILGILALLLFKRISWQGAIKGTKDKIKGHMIAIRIYQDDLRIVFTSVLKVVLRNFQYLALNFGPILPLLAPFVLIAGQLVVRYGFEPLPVKSEAELASMLPGQGTMIELKMKESHRAEVGEITVELPSNFRALSPLARNAADGVAVLEIAAAGPGGGEIRILAGGREVGTKTIVAGTDIPRHMQPERVSGFWDSWLWPAEPTFASDSPLDSVSFVYPDRELALLPGGAFGVLMTFFLSSIVFGIAVLKPLNIQI